MKNKINAVKNSIISLIAGDMMGTPVQFILRENLQEALKTQHISELIIKDSNPNIPFGSWSDDSSMTLCTIKSITEKSEIDLTNIIKYFVKWLYENYMTPFDKTFDVGNTTLMSINKYLYNDNNTLKLKDKIVPAGLNHINSNGNGSLMRILPVSLYCYFKKLSKEETFKTIKDVSSLTHAHPISILGCYIYTFIVFSILDGKAKDEIIKNLKNIPFDKAIPNEYKDCSNEYNSIIDGSIVERDAGCIDSSGYVKYTLEIALWGFYNTESIEDCIFKIIELGHDSDTNGAVGASLSGLYYGLKGIELKKYWMDKIIRMDMIKNLIDNYIKCLINIH